MFSVRFHRPFTTFWLCLVLEEHSLLFGQCRSTRCFATSAFSPFSILLFERAGMLFSAFLPYFVIVDSWRCRVIRNIGCCLHHVGVLAVSPPPALRALRKQNPRFCLQGWRCLGGAGDLSLPSSPRQRPFRPVLPPLPPSPL